MIVYEVNLFVSDSTALEACLRDHAARMRDDGAARSSDSFRAERRVLPSGAEY